VPVPGDGDLLQQSLPLSPGPGASSPPPPPPPPAADPLDLLAVTGCSPRPLGASRARLTRQEDSWRSGARRAYEDHGSCSSE